MILAAGWVFLPSCNGKFPEKVNQIDNMLSDLETAQKRVDSIDIKRVNDLYKTVNEQIHFLQKNYKNDTISRETAIMLGDYRMGYKSLQKLRKMHKKLNHEIEFTSTQLKDLKADIKNDKHTEKKVDEFIEMENKAIVFINENSAKVVKWQNDAINITKGMKPTIDSIILDMNKNGIR